VSVTEAKRFVNEHHRHNEAPESWRFGVGLEANGELVAVAMLGRPTGRGLDQKIDVEVTRVCIIEEGRYPNACSMLYGAVCRAAQALGYRNAYTYTLAEEVASSVKAAGFVLDAELDRERTWNSASRPRQEETLFGPKKRPTGPKVRWVRRLNP
jgi:hypothetical protein